MQLSERLLAVAKLVSQGNRLVDIGTDHGYIPIYLVEQKRVPSAIAMDINPGPLQRAKDHITGHGLCSYIETRLSDGVKALRENEADTMVIAGMGGGLVRKIIEEGDAVLKTVPEFVLQPQSEIDEVRRFLETYGYEIMEENMIMEDGKFYPMMKVIKGEMKYSKDCYYKYGKLLLKSKNKVLYTFLKKEQETYEKIRYELQGKQTDHTATRVLEIENELKCIDQALWHYVSERT